MQNRKISTIDIVRIGVMIALLEAVKLLLSSVANVELVTLLIMLFAYYYGKKTYIAVFAFVGVECIIWGIGTWNIMYLYIWPLLVFLVLFLKKRGWDSYLAYCILSGAFGLFFGMLCSLTYLAIGGFHMALAWWITGIPYDLIHCVSNFVLCLILWKPLCRLFQYVDRQNGLY